MKIPTITKEAIKAAKGPGMIHPYQIYGWLMKEQPELTESIDSIGDPNLTGTMMCGAVIVLRCLAQMPETPANDAQTSQDRLFTREQVQLAFGRTVLDYPADEQDEAWRQNEYPKLLRYFLSQLESN